MSNITSERIAGYEDSYYFHMSGLWVLPGSIPVVNTVSAAVRLTAAISLIAINLLKAPIYAVVGLGQFAWSKGENTTFLEASLDSIQAIAINVLFAVFSGFEAIPILGNIPHWAILALFGGAVGGVLSVCAKR